MKLTLTPTLDCELRVNWYPAIGTELDPKVVNWLELPLRIVKPVSAELSGQAWPVYATGF